MKHLAYIGIIVIAIGVIVFSFERGLVNRAFPRTENVITTSFYPLYFFTSEIVGNKVRVVNITPPGSEPHDYDLTAGDRVNIEKSSLLVLVGKNFEPWGDRISDSLKGSKTQVLNINDGEDPHFWLSPVQAKEKSALIYFTLKDLQPENSDYYTENYSNLNVQFDDLHEKFVEGLQNCKKKDIITTHDAFGYLAREYGLNVVPISGLSPDEEPSAKDIARIADFAKKNNIKHILFESLVSPKLAKTIASEIGAETLVLNPIEGLTKTEIASGKNYFTEMESNLVNLKIALECQ